MKIKLESGKYVVAVSGGVDSMVLLHLLQGQPGLELVVAHYDHGIRPDSKRDRELVRKVAKQYKLPFIYEAGRLGAEASEDQARQARYGFLRRVQKDHSAQAIVTAHHQDDLIETALINLLRGTGRKGLVSLKSQPELQRPLLNLTKKQLQDYAVKNKLQWHEDSTNLNPKYLRNYVRLELVPKLSPAQRQQLLTNIAGLRIIDQEIDDLLAGHQGTGRELDRQWFINLPHDVAKEVMAHWLRQNQARNINKLLIERLVSGAKTKAPGKQLDVNRQYALTVGKTKLALTLRER